MDKKVPGEYWTDEEIKEAINEWRRKKPDRLKSGQWKVEDVPFYEPDMVPRVDLWHRVDFLDEVDLIWGKKWGASGLGRLREVATVYPSEGDLHPFEKQDPIFMNRPKQPDLDVWQREHETFVQMLRDYGVTVHYMEYPKPPIGGYGPIRGTWAACEAFIAWGGALITKYGGWSPLSRGREVVLTKFLVQLGIPILLTVVGKGVFETGPLQPLTDDCVIVGLGMGYNRDGLEQVRPVLQRVGIDKVVELHLPGWLERNFVGPGSGVFHTGSFMCPLDLGKVLVDGSCLGFEGIQWFRDNRFELITPEPDEAWACLPACLLVLEPGKVMMHACAKKTIQKVRKAGVDVIEVPYEEGLCLGGGLYCSTLQLLRDPGPKLDDIK